MITPDLGIDETQSARARETSAANDAAASLFKAIDALERVLGDLARDPSAGSTLANGAVAGTQLAEAFAAHAAIAIERGRLDVEMHAAREFLYSITETCPETILTTDVRGRITWVSPSVEPTFDYLPDDLIGWPVSEIYPGGAAEARAIMARLNAAGQVSCHATAFPARRGGLVPVHASMALLRDANGAVTGTIAVLRVIPRDGEVRDRVS
jgi:PAS domain S-box-containing protein